MIPIHVLNNIRDVIQEHYTWITFKDFGLMEELYINDGDRLARYMCPTFRLVTRTISPNYRKGSTLSIPYYVLEQAIQRHCKDYKFQLRMDAHQLNMDDVNKLILTATWQQIDMELE